VLAADTTASITSNQRTRTANGNACLAASNDHGSHNLMPNEVAFADNSQLARNKRPAPRITPRVKRAIELIVHEKYTLNQAANEVGFTTRNMRLALERPHVLQFYKQQCVVFRDLRRARNQQRLAEIADAENNMPAVNAIKALELINDEQTANKQQTTPGVTIRIVNVATQPQHEQTNKTCYSTTNLEIDSDNNA
jgi:hypothetical protein